MPKKKTSSLGRKTPATKQKSNIRKNESSKSKEQRLKRNAEYIAELRRNETPEQTNDRLTAQKRNW